MAFSQRHVVSTLDNHLGSASAPRKENALWQMISIKVLPIFNGEKLRGQIEDVAQLVRKDDSSDTYWLEELLQHGCLTLSTSKYAKLSSDAGNSRSILTIYKEWTFFYTSVVPQLEALFVDIPDIRKLAFVAFRDSILLRHDADMVQYLFQLNQLSMTDRASTLRHRALVTQLLGVMSSLNTQDEAQWKIEEMWKVLGGEVSLDGSDQSRYGTESMESSGTPSQTYSMHAPG